MAEQPGNQTHTMALAKDKAKLAVAAVKGDDAQDLYVAVTKATLPDEVVPKEKHVRTLRIACSAHSSRNTVEYVIYKLSKRLSNPSWVVVLKALMTFHRLLRECDSSFQDQMLSFADRTGRHHLLSLERFADHSSKEAWDYAAWVRVYSAYLAERLDVYRSMRFDPEGNVSTAAQAQQQHMNPYENGGPAAGATGAHGQQGYGSNAYSSAYGGPPGTSGYSGGYGGGHSSSAGGPAPAPASIKLKDCSTAELLEHLPKMQRLMGRLSVCVPEGAAATHPVILAASEGVMNLADKFFEMERAQAVQGIELYKDNLALNERMNAYYATMQALPALKNIIQYPHLAPLPADFLTAMEEYVKEAPKEVDPATAAARRAGSGPVTANRVSSMAARGGTTSSAFAGGAMSLLPPPGSREGAEAAATAETVQPAAAAVETPQPAPQPTPKLPDIDLLSFDDAPGAGAAPYGYQPYGPVVNPFGAPFAGPTGGYGMLDPYGHPYMPYAGPTGGMGPQSMAIVPVGAVMGGMGAIVPYGMGPFAGPTGTLAPAGGAAVNPFNPFLATPPPAAPVEQGPVRLANDPLNQLTEELLKPKSKG
eukprot:gene8689-8870_t